MRHSDHISQSFIHSYSINQSIIHIQSIHPSIHPPMHPAKGPDAPHAPLVSPARLVFSGASGICTPFTS